MCGGKIFKTLRWFECRQTGLGLCHVTANCQPSFGRPKISLEVKNLVVLLSAQWLHCRLLGLLITFSGLAKVAIFTTNVDAENQTLTNHKCVCGVLNRHFCQTRVCASNVKYSSFKRRTPTGESPRNAGVTTRSLVSRKVVYREVCTEVSETASVCTDEQKLNRRHR